MGGGVMRPLPDPDAMPLTVRVNSLFYVLLTIISAVTKKSQALGALEQFGGDALSEGETCASEGRGTDRGPSGPYHVSTDEGFPVRALACCLFFAFAGSAHAAPMDGVYACAQIADSAARLSCYDQAVGKLKSAETAGDVAVVDRQGVRELEADSFGFRLPSFARLLGAKTGAETASVDEVKAALAAVRLNAEAQGVFVLDNGQTWRQIDTTRLTGMKSGQTVTIKRASLGSFMLLRANGAGIRVRRVE